MKKLIKKILTESDWDFFDLKSSEIVWDPEMLKTYLGKYGSLDGRHGDDDWHFTVEINSGGRECKQVWPNKTNEAIVLWETKYDIPNPPYYKYGEMCATYTFKDVCEYFNDGTWIVDQDVLNESKDWDWMKEVPRNPYEKVRTDSDYIGVWDGLAYEFQEACVDIQSGYVISSDYDGTIDIELILPEGTMWDYLPFGGRIVIWLEFNQENLYYDFVLFSNDSDGFEKLVKKEGGDFEVGNYWDITDPVKEQIRKLKNLFCDE